MLKLKAYSGNKVLFNEELFLDYEFSIPKQEGSFRITVLTAGGTLVVNMTYIDKNEIEWLVDTIDIENGIVDLKALYQSFMDILDLHPVDTIVAAMKAQRENVLTNCLSFTDL